MLFPDGSNKKPYRPLSLSRLDTVSSRKLQPRSLRNMLSYWNTEKPIWVVDCWTDLTDAALFSQLSTTISWSLEFTRRAAESSSFLTCVSLPEWSCQALPAIVWCSEVVVVSGLAGEFRTTSKTWRCQRHPGLQGPPRVSQLHEHVRLYQNLPRVTWNWSHLLAWC